MQNSTFSLLSRFIFYDFQFFDFGGLLCLPPSRFFRFWDPLGSNFGASGLFFDPLSFDFFSSGVPSGRFWLPFGFLLAPFGYLLAPFGSSWFYFGVLVAPFLPTFGSAAAP